MNKKDLIEAMFNNFDAETKITKTEIRMVLENFTAILTTQLVRGEKLTLPEIGTFSVKDRAARQGRNPSTGETMSIPARKAINFSPAKSLKDTVNY